MSGAVLVPLAWNRFHSSYEISADFLGPLRDRSNSHTPLESGDIETLIETQSELGKKLVPLGSSITYVHVREHDSYVEPASKLPVLGWTEHHHTIFRCEIRGLDLNGDKFSRIRFVDEHYYYMLDDVDSANVLPHHEIAK